MNAAEVLFARQPQRFLISSAVKRAHAHGTEVAKPIPSYQVYKGTAFAVVDQAVDFVLSKINLAVGTRAASTRAPVTYEMSPQVVREVTVNAPRIHEQRQRAGDLFPERLGVWNPGALPPSLTLEKPRQPHGSVLANCWPSRANLRGGDALEAHRGPGAEGRGWARGGSAGCGFRPRRR